jgi:transketolase
MPCTSLFDAQGDAYRDAVLPPACTCRVAVEAAVPDFWRRYVGDKGAVLGLSSFGLSAPAPQVYEHFGITAERLATLVSDLD